MVSHGPDGCRELFATYRKQFDSIETEFTNVIEYSGGAMLEWRSSATLAGTESPVTYRGVSIFDIGADTISGFRTYYDSAALIRPTADVR